MEPFFSWGESQALVGKNNGRVKEGGGVSVKEGEPAGRGVLLEKLHLKWHTLNFRVRIYKDSKEGLKDRRGEN